MMSLKRLTTQVRLQPGMAALLHIPAEFNHMTVVLVWELRYVW